MTFNPRSYLLAFVDSSVSKQLEDGSFPAGFNGPYNDEETPIRNTAHWCIMLAFCIIYEKQTNLAPKLRKALKFIMDKSELNIGYTHHMRNKKGKDKCNGVVGPAWVIEALFWSYEATGDESLLHESIRIQKLHKWNNTLNVWHRVETTGEVLTIDPTFNHQLWFASASSRLAKYDKQIEIQVSLFIKKVVNEVDTYKDGIIYHGSKLGKINNYLALGVKPFLRELKLRLTRVLKKKSFYEKSLGYHGFNLHAIAVLKASSDLGDLVSARVIDNIRQPVEDASTLHRLSNNKFGLYYNLTGYEFAFFSEAFGTSESLPVKYAQFQAIDIFEKNFQSIVDKETTTARNYQLCEYLKLKLSS